MNAKYLMFNKSYKQRKRFFDLITDLNLFLSQYYFDWYEMQMSMGTEDCYMSIVIKVFKDKDIELLSNLIIGFMKNRKIKCLKDVKC